MTIIKKIKFDNNYLEIEVKGNYVYKIPVTNEYVNNLFNKALKENKGLYKDIKYYDKCAGISLYPIWLAVGLFMYGLITNFILMDMVMMGCGGIAGISLLSSTIFKMASKKLQDKANNNEYFTKIYEYALTGKKDNNYQKSSVKQDLKNNEYAKKSNEIIQDIPINRNNNEYHLNSNEIIQDEIISSRKR